MNQTEERLLEVYKCLELLFKEKFNNEINSVTEYIGRMSFHKEEAIKYISDWEDTIGFLLSVKDKANIIVRKKKQTNISTEDIDNLEHFMDLVRKHEDPLQKYYITRGLEKIVFEPEYEDEPRIELDDPEYSMLVSYKTMFKIAPIVIGIVALIMLILWLYTRMNATLL